jgi:hypothetical protein
MFISFSKYLVDFGLLGGIAPKGPFALTYRSGFAVRRPRTFGVKTLGKRGRR